MSKTIAAELLKVGCAHMLSLRARDQGLTLIEFVVVIVILGILAAIAMVKYQNYSIQAHQSAVNEVAGALAAGAAINYSARQVGAAFVTVTKCSDLAGTLQGGALPSGFTWVSGDTALAASGATVTCTIQGPVPATTRASFTGIGAQ